MTTLSIVVPIHDVEDYLPQCLDSLLIDPALKIEVVGVDDASNDGSGTILDRYANEDSRLRPIHLERNVGLGGARNTGLAAASGDYVWFVDSDDWVRASSIARVVEQLERERPDVLLLGHLIVEGTEVRRAAGEEVLAHSFGHCPSPDPRAFRIFPAAWNRVVRRTFLQDLDLPFPDGAYEDLPVTIPVLAAAESVAVLDDVCLYYRQRGGSILTSGGEHHLSVIDQYELLFARLEALGERGVAARKPAYAFMVTHLFQLLGTGRIASDRLPDLFAAAVTLVHRHRPEQVPDLGAADRVREWLLRLGCWPLANSLRVAHRSMRGLRERASRLSSQLLRLSRGVRRLGFRSVLLAYYTWQRRRPIDERLVVYCSYWGEHGAAGNPAAIEASLRRLRPDRKAVWVTTAEHSDRLPVDAGRVIIGTSAYYRALASAGTVVSNVNLGNTYVKRSGQLFVQTHHGTPLKTMGIDERPWDTGPTSELLRRCTAWDVSVSSNAYSSAVWQMSYPVGFSTLEVGYPRNDALALASDESVAAARRAVGVTGESALLYAPTHRDGEASYQSRLDVAALAEALGDDYKILHRAHYFYRNDSGQSPERVVDATAAPIEELYLAADMLITDYSSVMFDYAVLDRPIVIFAPDWEEYRRRRGTYFDLCATPPGVVVHDQDELLHAISAGLVDDAEARRKRADFRARFCPWDDGTASDRVAKRILLGEH